MAKKILIVDDHLLVRMSLKLLLADFFPQSEIREAETFSETLSQLEAHRPGLVLLDIGIPGGGDYRMVEFIRKKYPDVILLVCSGMDEDEMALRCMSAGADGFLPKRASNEEMMVAFEAVSRREKYISARVGMQLLDEVSEAPGAGGQLLSVRETEVMNRLLEGKWVKEIAAELNLHANTVSTYKSRVFEKMGVSSTVELLKKLNRHRKQ